MSGLAALEHGDLAAGGGETPADAETRHAGANDGNARQTPVGDRFRRTQERWRTAIRRATPSAGMIQVRFDGYDLSRHALAPTPQPDTTSLWALAPLKASRSPPGYRDGQAALRALLVAVGIPSFSATLHGLRIK